MTDKPYIRVIVEHYALITADDECPDPTYEDFDKVECVPADYDLAYIGEFGDEFTAAGLAANYLQTQGILEPSTTPGWHRGLWYSDVQPEIDYETGEPCRYTFHLYGFSRGQEENVYRLLRERGVIF